MSEYLLSRQRAARQGMPASGNQDEEMLDRFISQISAAWRSAREDARAFGPPHRFFRLGSPDSE